jgi:tRNA threonylcarbamoyladenosine biosynthesis protein TsaB
VAAGLSSSDGRDFRRTLVALESRREDIYIQLFDSARKPVGEPAAVMPAVLGELLSEEIGTAPVLIAGDAAQRAASALPHREDIVVAEDSAPDAAGVLRASRGTWLRVAGEAPRPLYLRPPDVTVAAQRNP